MRKQRGISLVETVVALGVMSAIGVSMMYVSGGYAESSRIKAAAEHMRTVAAATDRYVRDHRGTIMTQASAVTPALISVPTLVSAGYLPTGFVSRNIFRQDVCALAFEPSTGAFSVLVVAEGGQSLDDVGLADFVSTLGAEGGGRFTTDGAAIKGAGGGWSLDAVEYDNKPNAAGRRCDGSPGVVRVQTGWPVIHHWIGEHSIDDEGFIHRRVHPERPDASTMNTPLNMGGNRIANLNAVTIGDACGAGVVNGELANDANGYVVSCVDGLWTSPGRVYWGPASGSRAALPVCDLTNMGETRRVLDIDSVFICNGIRWDVALDTAGVFSLPRHLQVSGASQIDGDLNVMGDASFNSSLDVSEISTARSVINAHEGIQLGSGQGIHNPGSMSIETAGDLHLKRHAAGGQVVIGGNGGSGKLIAFGDLRSQTGIVAKDRLTSNDLLEIKGVVMEGSACSTLGTMARTASGVPMYCEDFVWQRHKIHPLYSDYFRGYANEPGWITSTSGWKKNWCRNLSINAGTGSFISIALFGHSVCDTPGTCKISARIRNDVESVSVNTRTGPRNYKMAISTLYSEYAYGLRSYTLCLSANSPSASAPEASYSVSALQ